MRKFIALIVLGLAATHEPQADKRKGSYLRGAGRTGTAHDFENGRAVRLCSSMAPSADWDASAWTVTSNAPGMSSDDFTPGRWCGYVAQGLT